ncbi:MAG: lysylphosphatidylglycerol synthase transmembrane domain-containing protein [Anaerolineae bacterium]
MKKKRFWISLVISAVLLYFALRRIQSADVLLALQGTRLELLLLAALVRVALALVRAFRWQTLLTPATRRISLGVLFRTWLVGFFGNYTLPSESGEILKLYALGRQEHVSRTAILGTLFLERVSDVLILSLSLIALLLTLPLPAWVGQLGWLAAGLWIAGLGLLLALATRREVATLWADRLLRKLVPPLADWGLARFGFFVEGLNALRSLRVFGASLGLSVVVWGVQLLPLILVGGAMGLAIPAYGYLLLMVVFNLASLVPALPGRLGTLEFVFATVLALFQADQSLAFSYALLFRVTHLLPLLLGGIFFVAGERAGEATELRASDR